MGRHLLATAWLGCSHILWHTLVCLLFFGGIIMSLFGNLNDYKVGAVKKSEKKKKEPTLLELAQEKFGDDKQLMMWIEGYLDQKRQIHMMPPRLAWLEQLSILEQHPKSERVKEVRRCIAGNYRQIAYAPKYPNNNKTLRKEEETEEEIISTRGF